MNPTPAGDGFMSSRAYRSKAVLTRSEFKCAATVHTLAHALHTQPANQTNKEYKYIQIYNESAYIYIPIYIDNGCELAY